MKQNRKGLSILKKMLSVLLACGLVPTLFLPGMTVSAAGGTYVSGPITSGGEYVIPRTSIEITINTSEPVTLSPEVQSAVYAYNHVTINCVASGVDLTLNGIRISLLEDKNIISFTGSGNKLRMLGTDNLLANNQDMSEPEPPLGGTLRAQKSLIHVPSGVELYIYGPGKLSLKSKPDNMTTGKDASSIGGDAYEKGGSFHVMGGELYCMDGVDGINDEGGIIGGGFSACCRKIDILGGRVYGYLSSGHIKDDNCGHITINGDCFVYGKIRDAESHYTFTKGVWCNTDSALVAGKEGEQIVRGGSFTMTETEKQYMSETRNTTIEKGAQLTLSAPFRMDQRISNYGTLVIDDPSVVIATDGSENKPGGAFTNQTTGVITINPDAKLQVGNGGDRTAYLYNKGALNIESNGVLQIDNQPSGDALLHNYTFGSITVKPDGMLQIGSGGPGDARIFNYSTITVSPDATLQIGGGGSGNAHLLNYADGVVENNGTIFCQKPSLITPLGEIRGNEPTGEPVYEETHTSYYIDTPTDTLTQGVESDRLIWITPDKISYLGYANAGIKVTAITQPQGVTNGLTLKSLTSSGTEYAVEVGKLWNNEGSFQLFYNQKFNRAVKLLGNEPGEYEVTYVVVNLEDNSEITSSTVKYTVVAPPVETLSTLTGITINGKAIEHFDKSTLSYEAEIRADTDELTVTAAMSHPGASYTVQKPDSPVEGINVVTITCVSEDKSSTTVYTVKVNKPKLIEGIKALYLDGELCEDFDPQSTNSIVTISDAQMGSRFTYTLTNPSDQVLSDSLSNKALKIGNNICVVKIGDSRGVLKVQHVITVKVVKGAGVPGAQLSDNTNLKSLTVNGTAAGLTNDPAKIINIILNDSRSAATLKAEAEDSKATVTYTASLPIKPGNNLTTITVKSSDQSKQVRYTLCIRYQTLSNVPLPPTGTSGNTALKSVTVGGVQAVLPAAGSILVDVGRITEQPKIDVITEDPQAAVQLKYLSASVKTGNNMVQITVQSSDKSKKVTYMLVYRVS